MITTPEITAPKTIAPAPRKESRVAAATRLLFAPVDIAPLLIFRIAFGALLFIELCDFFRMALPRLSPNWVEPPIHFTYFGFGWVQPPPGAWMFLLIGVTLVATLGIVLGLFYRLSCAIFAVGFTWLFLIDQSNYMNHFYLICLLGFIAIFLPAHRAFSLDVRRFPSLRSATVPYWSVFILQAQFAIVYFFGGIAKINHDWLRGEPIRTWIYVGRAADKVPDSLKSESLVYFLSYGGLLFDLLIVPLLLWPRTRLPALGLATFFHVSNMWLFDVGIFPYLSIAFTLLFLPAATLRRLIRLKHPPTDPGRPSLPDWSLKFQRGVTCVIGGYLAIHLLLPFRHWLYPGNVSWTEEGHRFAWHMMLRTKSGNTYFVVEERSTGKLWRINPRPHLSAKQYFKMSDHPEMILQFAHFLRERWKPIDIAVFAVAPIRLNGRPPRLLINPDIDLSKIQYGLHAAPWILPLENNHPHPPRFRFARSTE